MRLKSKLYFYLVVLMIFNGITLIAAAPPRYVYPISHFLFIILGVLDLVSIAWLEYLAGFDYRKKM